MPDITMCGGGACLQKMHCYRFRAIPTRHKQSYFVTPPVKADGTCEYQTEIIPGDHLAKETENG